MVPLSFLLSSEGPAAYLQIADAVRVAIEQGHLLPGERLPSCRRMAEAFGVHRHTVMASMSELKAQGWVESRERSAYFVAGDLPDKYFASRLYETATGQHQIRLPFARRFGAGSIRGNASEVSVDLSTGQPDSRLFPLAELKSCVSEAFRSVDDSLMRYGEPRGTPRLRRALADHLRQVRGITAREIFITNSAVEGIFLLAHLFLKPGDVAGIEAIGFRPAIDAIRSTGASIVAVSVGGTGLDPDDLERKLARTKIRLLYLTPLHQYPTTVTLGIENRKRIYALAQKHRFAIIEDDYDHEYHYASQPLAPIAAEDPSGLVMYVSSFSKVMFPAIRVGFLALPAYVSEGLQQLRRMTNRQNNTIIEEGVGRWIEAGGLERHLKRTRRIYARRRDTLCDAIDGLRADGLKLDYDKPNGGMTIWLNTHTEADNLTRAAEAMGVRLTPDAISYAKPRRERTHVRLGFASHNEEELRAGTSVLRTLLNNIAS